MSAFEFRWLTKWRVEWLHGASHEAEFGFWASEVLGVYEWPILFVAADRLNMTEPWKGAILYLEPFVTVHWSERVNLIINVTMKRLELQIRWIGVGWIDASSRRDPWTSHRVVEQPSSSSSICEISERPYRLMAEAPSKRQKRSDFRASLNQQQEEQGEVKLPRKKFYRQRAHANPFSDHDLS